MPASRRTFRWCETVGWERSKSGTSSHTQTLPACLRRTSTSWTRTGSASALAIPAMRSACWRATSGYTTGAQQGSPGGRFCFGASARYTSIYLRISIEFIYVNGLACQVMPADVHLHDPQTLYRHWEDEQWSPFAIELEPDAEQWREMTGEDRSLVFWALSSLMVAEERITTKFSGLVGAYGSEEEATFLATQQVDEARHMQFYARYQDEVIADPGAIAEHVERARAQLSPAFAPIFDQALVQAHEQLVANPADVVAKVEFVTTYHLVIEATLGLTAFNFITRYFEEQDLLPGFVEGYTKVHHDEQRHIGYGTWYLQAAVRAEPQTADTVRAVLRRLLPTVAESLTPPGREGTDWDALGASGEEIGEVALGGLDRRLKIIGVSLQA